MTGCLRRAPARGDHLFNLSFTSPIGTFRAFGYHLSKANNNNCEGRFPKKNLEKETKC